jgi:hypothetical protein
MPNFLSIKSILGYYSVDLFCTVVGEIIQSLVVGVAHMSKQRMVSETRGIGNLLTERRYFAVPAHHRVFDLGSG